jgi:hypothetical protein
VLERQAELEQLIAWSQRKQLTGVRRNYQNKLIDQEQKLFRAAVRSPQLLTCARWLYSVKFLLAPTPRYYSGYAAKYKKNFLTGRINKTYSYM